MLDKIKSMVGNSYLYHAHEHQVMDVTQKGEDLYEITTDKTDKKKIALTVSEIEKEFLPIEDDGYDKKLALFNKIQKEGIPLVDVSTELMAVIKKVKESPAYIHQAQTIILSAKALVDLKRLQIDLLRIMADLKSL